jgi:hypothetical protein
MVGFPHSSLTKPEQPAFLHKLNTAFYGISKRQFCGFIRINNLHRTKQAVLLLPHIERNKTAYWRTGQG